MRLLDVSFEMHKLEINFGIVIYIERLYQMVNYKSHSIAVYS